MVLLFFLIVFLPHILIAICLSVISLPIFAIIILLIFKNKSLIILGNPQTNLKLSNKTFCRKLASSLFNIFAKTVSAGLSMYFIIVTLVLGILYSTLTMFVSYIICLTSISIFLGSSPKMIFRLNESNSPKFTIIKTVFNIIFLTLLWTVPAISATLYYVIKKGRYFTKWIFQKLLYFVCRKED